MKSEVENKKITDEVAAEIQALPVLSGFFPHHFKNRVRVDTVSVGCAQCGKDIPPEHIHAHVAMYEHSVAVDAYAVCFECKLITPCKLRFSDDGSMLVADPAGNWQKRRFVQEKLGWLSRLKAMFSSHG